MRERPSPHAGQGKSVRWKNGQIVNALFGICNKINIGITKRDISWKSLIIWKLKVINTENESLR